MKSLRFCAVGASAAVVALVGGLRTAKAAGFATQQFGGEQGSVVATNPTAVYFNPGALGFSEGTELGMYGQLAIRHASWTHQIATSDIDPKMPGVPSGVDIGTANLLNVFGGAAVGGSTHIGNLVIATGFFAPFFGISHWGKNDAFTNSAMFAGAHDGIARWFAIDGKIEILYFSGAVAYKLGPLSIGAAGNFISSTVSSFKANTRGGGGLPNSLAEGRAFLDVHGFNGSVGGGAMLEVVPKQFFIGVAYQSQPGFGEQTLKGDLNLTGPGGYVHYDAYLNQQLPDVYRAGLKFHPLAIPWEFRLFGDWTRWSVMQTQCVAPQGQPCGVNQFGGNNGGAETQAYFRRLWKDTYGVRAGVSYFLNPSVELFVGGGFETAAVPDETMAPDLFDADNIQAAVGGRFALSKTLFFTASYTNIQYLNRDNTGKSTLATLPNGNYYQFPTVEPDGGGQYTQWVGVFTGNLEAVF
jgi:long-chain fatty acid transport protein